jgi:hypothetical protein
MLSTAHPVETASDASDPLAAPTPAKEKTSQKCGIQYVNL